MKSNTQFSIFVFLLIMFLGLVLTSTKIFGSSISNFTQTINPGVLSVDIVDTTNSYTPVANPGVAMGAVTFNFSCQNSTGTFGTNSQAIYVQNPDAADGGWTVSLAASNPTSIWDSAGTDMDFNDASGGGCTDGADTDTLKGQMIIDPSVASIDKGICIGCTTTNISVGSSNAFVEGSVDSITIVTGAVASNDIGDWKITGVSINQRIPAEQPAASDYDINMTLSIVAS